MEDDIFSGSDYTFDTSDPTNTDSSIFGSSDSSDPYAGLDQYGSGPSGGGDSSINSLSTSGIDSSLGSTSSGLGGTGFNWGSLVGPGLGALQGYAKSAEAEKMSKENWDQKFKYEQKMMALQEQYYQAHGQQLEGAMGNFKQYAPAGGGNGQVFAGLNQMRPGNAGVPPQTQAMSGGGLLNYGY